MLRWISPERTEDGFWTIPRISGNATRLDPPARTDMFRSGENHSNYSLKEQVKISQGKKFLNVGEFFSLGPERGNFDNLIFSKINLKHFPG